jgi:biphenyl-2,3-diol 1,2-dioxygenase
MSAVMGLGYLGFGVSNRNLWKDYAVNFLGLQYAGQSEDKADLYRMDENSQRFMLHDSDVDDILYAGFEVADGIAFNAMHKRLVEAGIVITRGSKADCKSRAVLDLMYFPDPDGLRIEIYYGAKKTYENPFHSGKALSGFVAGDQGLGHIVLTASNLDNSLAFYRDLLGFRISDYITIDFSPEARAEFIFLHCNARHHTVALVPLPLPKRLQHFMLQVESLDDVGFAYDLARSRGEHIEIEIGRHSNDHMVSFYVATPSGFDVEYGWGARTVNDENWRVERHDTPSIWGHKRLG